MKDRDQITYHLPRDFRVGISSRVEMMAGGKLWNNVKKKKKVERKKEKQRKKKERKKAKAVQWNNTSRIPPTNSSNLDVPLLLPNSEERMSDLLSMNVDCQMM